jgi:hypothetical protein
MYELLKDRLYPNPARTGEKVYLLYDFQGPSVMIKIVFITLDGRTAKNEGGEYYTGRGKAVFDTAGLAPGVYFYRISYHSTLDISLFGGKETKSTGKLVITR